MNRLGASSSPYLQQHADNPVPWWPWGEEALEHARRRDVPILLSIGYSACHWCHVMARESFQDEGVAQIIERDFVAIKVDREERPDIDSVYMAATVALTGRGGWPMTCLLTPTGEPFWAGTYLPREHFTYLLTTAAQAWQERREEVVESAERIADALRTQSEASIGVDPALIAVTAAARGAGTIDEQALDEAEDAVAGTYDWSRGGFGGAPKFPPAMVLEWLLRHHARTGTQRALAMVEHACEAMARGGMYDQLGGGFARYSVDADWVVPHFEKMLYDNALLLRVYTRLAARTGSDLAARVARDTSEFLLRDLRTAQGGFASALDADTVVDGVSIEGYTYAWTPQQLTEVLGQEDGLMAAGLLGVTSAGTFENGTSTLQLRQEPQDLQWWQGLRARLLQARNERPQPGRDDKVVTAWNGLAIGALAQAGSLLDEPSYLQAAADCAEFVVDTHIVHGRLRRLSRDGTAAAALGVAEDYGDLAHGLLDLHMATGEQVWLQVAGALLDSAVPLFSTPGGGFYDTGSDAEQLLLRPRTEGDNAEPSGQSSLAGALLSYAALTGSAEHLQVAQAAVRACAVTGLRAPRFGGWALAAAESLLAGPLQVAIVHPVGEAAAAEPLRRAALVHGLVGGALVCGEPESQPLLKSRPMVGAQPTAYVCRGTLCGPPVCSPEALLAALNE
ncbi:thioredoxin domain-containing protein [Gephyromycinifex aptenodytis]|uniref:thioredoxin domain-containing protein n=1 Tax=Gephyromycinifex aptenodytis TaxID=2716227 RepID=UPI0014459EFB|nr:thioredoxin domain-containing protein [Gephyromycinifex aptenodytis]